MNIEDLPKGRIGKFEYMAKMDGDYYDVFSVRRKIGQVNLGFERGTFWTDIKNIEELIKNN